MKTNEQLDAEVYGERFHDVFVASFGETPLAYYQQHTREEALKAVRAVRLLVEDESVMTKQ